jgi:DNA-binding beta-propeller fold protein YncE
MIGLGRMLIGAVSGVVEWNDISTASYDNESFDVSSEEYYPSGLFFKSDGTKLYIVGYGDGTVFQYSLSTAWDISTASYDNESFDVSSEESHPYGLFFKPDGTKLYIVGNDNDTVYQYSLSTAWDISTASYDNESFYVGSEECIPFKLFFKSDGTKFYIVGIDNDTVYQYSLSTAWDISTASYDNESFDVSSEESYPLGLFFKSDGTKLYIVGIGNDTVYQYSLSTAWDISTASYDNESFYVGSEDSSPYGLFFKPDGTKLYIVGNRNDTVYQYSL